METSDLALRAAARVDRPSPDPDVLCLQHAFDWLEDVYGWVTPMDDGVWVPVALLNRRMMLSQVLSNKESISFHPRTTFARRLARAPSILHAAIEGSAP